MRKISAKIGVAALAAVLLAGFAFAISPANAGGPKSKIGLARLLAPASGDWLIHHYDNRGGQFDDFVGTPTDPSNAGAFEDSAEVEFDGNIGGIGRATVKQSAGWTWSTYDLGGGSGGQCAFAYDTSVTLVQIHTHATVTTDPNNGLGGGVDSVITGSLPLVTADVGLLGTHTFGATVLITDAFGESITGAVLGGTNCEVEILPAVSHGVFSHPPGADTVNTVTTVFDITGGDGAFTDASGDGVLVFTYDTLEPHNLRSASISLNLELP